jgi:hypothetical protein
MGQIIKCHFAFVPFNPLSLNPSNPHVDVEKNDHQIPSVWVFDPPKIGSLILQPGPYGEHLLLPLQH